MSCNQSQTLKQNWLITEHKIIGWQNAKICVTRTSIVSYHRNKSIKYCVSFLNYFKGFIMLIDPAFRSLKNYECRTNLENINN
jgi:hypothetical protein